MRFFAKQAAAYLGKLKKKLFEKALSASGQA
jgi:hypothetical protein